MKQVLISDANILFDIEDGRLTPILFQLSFVLLIPDVLFIEELGTRYQHLVEQGLRLSELSSHAVNNAYHLVNRYNRVSRHDCFALALAKQENCPLLTGDRSLRKAAKRERIPVMGTIWLVEQMILEGKLTRTQAQQAYDKMKASDRRLPWDKVEESLNSF